ncbi:MAG: (d)CMP kinase [Nitrospirota bacterium]
MGKVIAIDGPSGAGKSTVAGILAQRLGYLYVDTGAIYRSVGWKAKEKNVDINDSASVKELCRSIKIKIDNDRIYVDGCDVTGEIRTPEMGMMASKVSAIPEVRKSLLELQRGFVKEHDVVMEGRDIGTVVFPEASIKFYIDASVIERGKRRLDDLIFSRIDSNLQETVKEIIERDYNDTTREIAPLRKADDSIYIDSTDMSVDEVVEKMLVEISKLKIGFKGQGVKDSSEDLRKQTLEPSNS